jgi:hypothetical protein
VSIPGIRSANIYVLRQLAFQKELKKDERMNQVSNILGAMELKMKEIILG